jgi:hypothetical protein
VFALETHLKMARASYESLVYSFAMDIDLASELRGRGDAYWLESGLCTTEEEVSGLFDTVDEFINHPHVKDTADSLVDRAYIAHGALLNHLSALHGDEPRRFPGMPPPPSFESKHAPYINYEAPKKTRTRTARSNAKVKAGVKGKAKATPLPEEPEEQSDDEGDASPSAEEGEAESSDSSSDEEDDEEVDQLLHSSQDAPGSPDDEV